MSLGLIEQWHCSSEIGEGDQPLCLQLFPLVGSLPMISYRLFDKSRASKYQLVFALCPKNMPGN
jgi:hypothetical protein